MGLSTSHNCWRGSYTSFNDWRRVISNFGGYGDLDSYNGFGGKNEFPKNDLLTVLLNHSDCEGEIDYKVCDMLADRLNIVLRKLNDYSSAPDMEYHIADTKQFIAGLRDAFDKKENVEFY